VRQARERIELQRGESAPEHGLRGAGIVLRLLHLVAPAVGIDAHARTAGTTEQIVHRLPGDLSGNVPQRLLDAGGGAIELERAAALRVVVERDLQDMADMERVSADEIAPELLDLRGDGTVTVILAVGLAPADDAGIGGEAHEHEILSPAGMDREVFDAGDLHRGLGRLELHSTRRQLLPRSSWPGLSRPSTPWLPHARRGCPRQARA
jgi:hypothetical protein